MESHKNAHKIVHIDKKSLVCIMSLWPQVEPRTLNTSHVVHLKTSRFISPWFIWNLKQMLKQNDDLNW